MYEGTSALPLDTYLDEPPLSPLDPNGLRVTKPIQEPAPAPERPASIETLLLRHGLITSEQMANALGERILTGKDVPTIALERGWITHEDLERVRASMQPAAAAPAPVAAPAAAAPAAAPAAPAHEEPEAVPLPPAALFVRLTNGDRIPAGEFADHEAAKNAGRMLTLRIGHEGEWPFLDGRYIHPEAVVSIDVESL